MRQEAGAQQQQQMNKIDDVYAMIGKVRRNMDVIAEINKQTHEEHLVNTISSSNSSPTHTIKSVSMRQSNPFGGDRSIYSKSERSLQGSLSFRNRQQAQPHLPNLSKQLNHLPDALNGQTGMKPQYSSSDQLAFLDLQQVITDENNSDKRPSICQTFDEFKRGSLPAGSGGTDGTSARIKPHSALIQQNKNKSSTSRAFEGQALAPIFAGEEDQQSDLSSFIQIKDQDESEGN